MVVVLRAAEDDRGRADRRPRLAGRASVGSQAALPCEAIARVPLHVSGTAARHGCREGRAGRGARRHGLERDLGGQRPWRGGAEPWKGSADKPLPRAIIPSDGFNTNKQRAALLRFGESVRDEDGRYLALRRLLQRDLPLGGAPVQTMDLDEQKALAVGLDHTYLFVQGPPGSGKTYRGARLITELLRQGKRVGVTSQSHKVIHHLLDGVEEAAA